jgi:nickel transport protein
MKILTLFLILLASSAAAHELGIYVHESGQAVVMRASYGGHDPARNARIAVFAPDAPEPAFQIGQTDLNGFFSFVPDQPGEWVVQVDDETGHRERTTVTVGDEAAASVEAPHSHQPTWQKLLIGLSLIVGFSGLFFGLRNRGGGGA